MTRGDGLLSFFFFFFLFFPFFFLFLTMADVKGMGSEVSRDGVSSIWIMSTCTMPSFSWGEYE